MFGRHLSRRISLRQCYNITCNLSSGSSSDARTSIIRHCLLNRNTSTLKSELLKLVDTVTTTRKHGKVINGRTTTDNTATAVVSFPALAARLCVTAKVVDLDLAFDILECLDESKPNSMLLGMYEVIDRCLLMGHVTEAASAYRRLHNTGHKLDISGLERLVSALVYDCRLDDLTMVLNNHSLSDDMLVNVVEPLVLSGDLVSFAKLFRRYLDQKRSMTNPLQCPDRVSRVLQSLTLAWLRRFSPRADVNPHIRIQEMQGLKDIHMAMEVYHMRLSQSPHESYEYSNYKTSPSYTSLFQFYHAVGVSSPLDHIMLDQLLGIDPQTLAKSSIWTKFLPGQAMRENMDLSQFPYLCEGDGMQHVEVLHQLKLNDLTQEIRRRANHSAVQSNSSAPSQNSQTNMSASNQTSQSNMSTPSQTISSTPHIENDSSSTPPRLLLYHTSLFPHALHVEIELRKISAISEYVYRRQIAEVSNNAETTALIGPKHTTVLDDDDDDDEDDDDDDFDEDDDDDDDDDDEDSTVTLDGDDDDDDDDHDGSTHIMGLGLSGGPGEGYHSMTMLHEIEDAIDLLADPEMDKFTQHMHSRGRAHWLPTSGDYVPPDITAELARMNLPPPGYVEEFFDIGMDSDPSFTYPSAPDFHDYFNGPGLGPGTHYQHGVTGTGAGVLGGGGLSNPWTHTPDRCPSSDDADEPPIDKKDG